MSDTTDIPVDPSPNNTWKNIGAGLLDVITFGGYSNNKNYELQKQNLDYQKELQNLIFQREDTAVSRRMADLQANGLSKTLASGSGANAGAVVKTEAPQIGSMRGAMNDMLSNAIAMRSQQNQNALNGAQVENIRQDTLNKYQDMITKENYNLQNEYRTKALELDNLKKEQDINLTKEEIEKRKKEREKLEKDLEAIQYELEQNRLKSDLSTSTGMPYDYVKDNLASGNPLKILASSAYDVATNVDTGRLGNAFYNNRFTRALMGTRPDTGEPMSAKENWTATFHKKYVGKDGTLWTLVDGYWRPQNKEE